MLDILICDDNQAVTIALRDMLQSLVQRQDSIRCFLNADLLEAYINQRSQTVPDLLFLDIDLNGVSGIEVAKRLRRRCPTLQIVFITGKAEYSQDIFDAEPAGLLLKPIDPRRLEAALNSVRQRLEKESPRELLVQQKGVITRVPLREILYIESVMRKVFIHTEQTTLDTYQKLTAMEEELPSCFARTHQSYLVNLEFVDTLNPSTVSLKNGTVIPVSKARSQEVKRKFLDYIGKNL